MSELSYSASYPLSEADRESCLEFAKAVVVAAGEATLPFFRNHFQAENKRQDGGYDPVTQADRAAEQVIRNAIADRFPEHGIYGEEFGLKAGNGLTWVIDPIDGTRAFMSGVVHWGVLLGLFDGQDPVLGVMYQPFTRELFWGDSRTAWHHQAEGEIRRLRVSGCERVEEAVLTTTGPYFFEDRERAAFAELESAVRMRRYGGDCYIYGMLAMGFVDITTDYGLKPYDIQALVPIIRGAGGVVTTVAGENPSLGGWIVATATQALHDRVLLHLRKALERQEH